MAAVERNVAPVTGFGEGIHVWPGPGNHEESRVFEVWGPAMNAPPFDIYIGYRRGDREIAASLARRLEARGLSVQYEAGITGQSSAIPPEIAAMQARLIVLLISSETNDGRVLRQLGGAADRLSRPVVSLLLENVQPDGAALAALAGRIWIRAHPEPMARIEEIADLLAQLAGKGPVKPPPPPPETLEEREHSLDAAISDLLNDAVDPDERAPTDPAAYTGRAGSGGASALMRGGVVAGMANLVTLGLYGAMARRRAIRSFRSNIRKL